jgi:hypothetical protein
LNLYLTEWQTIGGDSFEVFWWLHVGILIFMNYLYFSETPAYTVGFSKYVFCRNPLGQFDNLEA